MITVKDIADFVEKSVQKALKLSDPIREVGDSMDFIELVNHMEIQFDLVIPNEQFAKFVTVGDLIFYVAAKV